MNGFTGTWALIRLILRRDRVRLPVWIVSIVGLVYASAVAVIGLYDDPTSIATYHASVGSSAATIAMNGPPTGLDTIGGIAIYETVLLAVLGIAFMAIFTTVRHTRGDEEAGRIELLGATRLGRQSPILAAALVSISASALVGAGIAVSFLAAGLPAEGSLLYGTAMGGLGLVFTAVALVFAQVSAHGRGATGMTLGLFAALFLVRAVGDVTESWIWVVSPIGWSQHVAAFETNDWWPLALSAAATVLLLGFAGWLTTRRDLGAGLVQPRLGRREASPRLATPVGLALRMQRGVLIGWIATMALLGTAYGSLIKEVEDMMDANPALADLLGTMAGGDMTEIYLSFVVSMSAMIATGFTIMSVLRLKAEEDHMFLEQVLATPLGRVRWSLGSLAVTAVGTVILLVVHGVGLGVSAEMVSRSDVSGVELFWAALAYTPACLLLGAATFAVFGWWPRGAPAGWGLLAAVAVIVWMGTVLKLPEWLIDLTPYSETPQLPLEQFSLTPVLALTAVTLGLLGLGLWGLRRRDIQTA